MTVKGDESGTSFKQALYFKQIGFKLNDTMILRRESFSIPSSQSRHRYHQTFEYMFIFAKNFVKTFNPIRDKPNKTFGKEKTKRMKRYNNDVLKYWPRSIRVKQYGMRLNVWDRRQDKTIESKKHPATFPLNLALDHIKSWSNEGDLILDPFLGSGTTYKMALKLNRKPIGIEINPEYIKIAKQRCLPLYSTSII